MLLTDLDTRLRPVLTHGPVTIYEIEQFDSEADLERVIQFVTERYDEHFYRPGIDPAQHYAYFERMREDDLRLAGASQAWLAAAQDSQIIGHIRVTRRPPGGRLPVEEEFHLNLDERFTELGRLVVTRDSGTRPLVAARALIQCTADYALAGGATYMCASLAEYMIDMARYFSLDPNSLSSGLYQRIWYYSVWVEPVYWPVKAVDVVGPGARKL